MDFSRFYMDREYSLDITDWKQKGLELKKEILNAVKDTQRAVIRAYPNKLKMTLKQYKDLMNRPEMISQEHDGQEFYLYRTISKGKTLNVMEVEIEQ